MKVTRTVWAGGKDGDHFRSLRCLVKSFWTFWNLRPQMAKSAEERPTLINRNCIREHLADNAKRNGVEHMCAEIVSSNCAI